MEPNLYQYLEASAQKHPNATAVQEADGRSITYGEIDYLSARMCDRLVELGVHRGDRVGVWIRKSIDTVATIFGILKAGAAYVPLDPTAPAARNGYILRDCAVSAIVAEERFKSFLPEVLAEQTPCPALLIIDGVGGGSHLRAMLDQRDIHGIAPSTVAVPLEQDDLAFILYTSGSTGRPKGVQLTHLNAVTFIEWCSRTFAVNAQDRVSSHAPFHFDLSVFDMFVTIKHAATMVLITEEIAKQPSELAQLISDTKINIWYSAPSILSLMAQFGDLDSRDYSSLRLVLFAGEVFPVSHLRSLVKHWPHARYYNLYGPTETNVCTCYEVPTPVPEDRTEPMPIGKICSHLEGIVMDASGCPVARGIEGELGIRGPAVTRGYWNLPEQSLACFIEVGGETYYRTGDMVREDDDGNLRYLGRKDRMIKKRGYRVELGEIEVCLYQHPGIQEAAVIALADISLGMKVHAHVVAKQGNKLSLIDVKTFCSRHVPGYMIPDQFSFHASLPKTSTDKVDYQTLKMWSGG
jgi:amino acid adenylation domain-containing protein